MCGYARIGFARHSLKLWKAWASGALTQSGFRMDQSRRWTPALLGEGGPQHCSEKVDPIRTRAGGYFCARDRPADVFCCRRPADIPCCQRRILPPAEKADITYQRRRRILPAPSRAVDRRTLPAVCCVLIPPKCGEPLLLPLGQLLFSFLLGLVSTRSGGLSLPARGPVSILSEDLSLPAREFAAVLELSGRAVIDPAVLGRRTAAEIFRADAGRMVVFLKGRGHAVGWDAERKLLLNPYRPYEAEPPRVVCVASAEEWARRTEVRPGTMMQVLWI